MERKTRYQTKCINIKRYPSKNKGECCDEIKVDTKL